MKLFVVIPAYNEEATIGKVIDDIPRRIKGISSVNIIVVDDGSSDDTARLAHDHGAIVLKHVVNRGVGRAFRTGVEAALKRGADIIVNMDGDGQFNAKDIPKLIQPIITGSYDFVTCTRFADGSMTGKMPFIKRIGNKFFTALISFLVGQKFTDTQCGFRAYSREAALRLTVYADYTYTQEVFLDLANKGLRMTEVPCRVLAQREHGSSRVLGKGVMHYFLRSMKIIIRSYRDYKALEFFGVPGLVFLSIGLASGLGSFIYWLINHQTTPVKTYILIAIFFTLTGLIFQVLALIADMFGRIRKNQEEILYRLKKKELEKVN